MHPPPQNGDPGVLFPLILTSTTPVVVLARSLLYPLANLMAAVAAPYSPSHDFNEKQMSMHDITEDSPENTVVNDEEPSSAGTLTPTTCEGVGTAPEESYAKALPAWRMAVRRFIMRNLHAESEVLGRMQRRIRSPWWDAYFKYTSMLGTHTFILVSLPVLFFFGYAEAGRGCARVETFLTYYKAD